MIGVEGNPAWLSALLSPTQRTGARVCALSCLETAMCPPGKRSLQLLEGFIPDLESSPGRWEAASARVGLPRAGHGRPAPFPRPFPWPPRSPSRGHPYPLSAARWGHSSVPLPSWAPVPSGPRPRVLPWLLVGDGSCPLPLVPSRPFRPPLPVPSTFLGPPPPLPWPPLPCALPATPPRVPVVDARSCSCRTSAV